MPEPNPVNEIDLHIHTLASQDGQYSPAELFAQVAKHRLRVIAFADHDSVASVTQGISLAGRFPVEFVPAIEITTAHAGHELHLLAYFIDPENPALQSLLDRVGHARLGQSRLRCQRLRDLGFALNYDRVLELSAGKPPTAFPIFLAIMENPANTDFPPAQRYHTGDRSNSPVYNFAHDYFLKDGPAYVETLTIDTTDAVSLVRSWHAVPILAHPGRTPLSLIDDLVPAGLMGLEAYNLSHSAQDTADSLALAARLGLLVTAGSDFHGPKIKPDILLARLPYAGYDLYEKLQDAASLIR